ncbi:putative choline kinase 1 [Ananas comosus]|uniref:Putative choline kinase 1 n=1 Tax=Ananas comosus TaxID=4615 RepID=A0A199UTF8_ANACO|nr:putative choline kinase 1 [Ananas comosus]
MNSEPKSRSIGGFRRKRSGNHFSISVRAWGLGRLVQRLFWIVHANQRSINPTVVLADRFQHVGGRAHLSEHCRPLQSVHERREVLLNCAHSAKIATNSLTRASLPPLELRRLIGSPERRPEPRKIVLEHKIPLPDPRRARVGRRRPGGGRSGRRREHSVREVRGGCWPAAGCNRWRGGGDPLLPLTLGFGLPSGVAAAGGGRGGYGATPEAEGKARLEAERPDLARTCLGGHRKLQRRPAARRDGGGLARRVAGGRRGRLEGGAAEVRRGRRTLAGSVWADPSWPQGAGVAPAALEGGRGRRGRTPEKSLGQGRVELGFDAFPSTTIEKSGSNWVLNRFLFHRLHVVHSPPSVTEFLLSSFLRRSLSSALLSPPLSSLHSLSSPCRTQQRLHPPWELRPPLTKSSEARTPSAPPAGTHGAVVRRRRRGGGDGEGGVVGARGDADEGGDDERGLPGAVAEEETGAAEEEEVRKKKVLLRIYGDGTDLFFDLADEVCTFECISRHGQGPRVLARFPNGRIEEFIHARIMDEFMNGIMNQI